MAFNNSPQDNRRARKSAADTERLLRLLESGPMTLPQLITRLGRSRAIVHQRIARLRDAGSVVKLNRKGERGEAWYSLPNAAASHVVNPRMALSRIPPPFRELHRDPFAHMHLAMTVRR